MNLLWRRLLGVFILWFGWFGFNGGSQLALASAADVVAMTHVLVNTNLAGAGGVIAALAVSRPILGRVDLFAGLNGAIGGLVSITAGPDITSHHWAIVIGAIGAIICTAAIKLLEKIRIDDVVGAVPAHLFAGVWGTLAASFAAGANIGIQLLGVVSIGAFAFAASWVTWSVLDWTMGARVSHRVEQLGQDVAELGIDAYPESCSCRRRTTRRPDTVPNGGPTATGWTGRRGSGDGRREALRIFPNGNLRGGACSGPPEGRRGHRPSVARVPTVACRPSWPRRFRTPVGSSLAPCRASRPRHSPTSTAPALRSRHDARSETPDAGDVGRRHHPARWSRDAGREIPEGLPWSQHPTQLHEKPCVFVNIDSHSGDLFRCQDCRVEKGRPSPKHRALAR